MLVERIRATKHRLHGRDIRNIPITNILVERICYIKHTAHISHIRYIPISNILVESSSNIEHYNHASSYNIDGTYTKIENNGFLLKWSDEIEFDSNLAIQPNMQFYSTDTNTIYPPQLEIKWRDYQYNKGTLQTISTPDIYAAIDNNQGVFYSESINQFRVNCRPEFPTRTFQTSSIYTDNFALPEESYYAIKDLDTNEYIIGFDKEFTQISCDPTGSYFTLYMNGLEPERYYEILIQTVVDGNTIVKDDQYYFKVVNG